MDNTIKIPLHSITDLITNSSTVIYTHSEKSEAILRDMINEMFKVLKIGKKCEDIFSISVTLEDPSLYYDMICDSTFPPVEFAGLTGESLKVAVDTEVKKVINSAIEKPCWMKLVEQKVDKWSDQRPSTTLNIVPKSPEFSTFASLVRNFLYSVEVVESRDG